MTDPDLTFRHLFAAGTTSPLYCALLLIGRRLAPRVSATVAVHVAAVVLCLVPLSLVPVDLLLGCGGLAAAWALLLAVLNYGQIVFAWIVWRRIGSFPDELDHLLGTTPLPELGRLLGGVRRWLTTRSMAPFVLVAGLTAILSYLAFSATRDSGSPCPTVVALVLLTGVLAGHSAYFTTFGIWLSRRLMSFSALRVTWPAPINTPALVELSKTARLTAGLGLLLFVVAQPPLIYAFVMSRSPLVTVIYVGSFVLHLGYITVVGLVVQRWLSRRVDAEKRRALTELAERIEASRDRMDGLPHGGIRHAATLTILRNYVDIYRAIDATPSSFLGSAVLTQYVASLLAVALQFAIPIVARL
ncbi:MAG: hypothetical protein GEV03_13835 [Streptosporangiales bacterium]|nr:hypothetical protein [Streptosporangiales bacterium]